MRILNLCETAQGGVGIYQSFLSAMNGHGVTHHHILPEEHAEFLGPLENLRVFKRSKRGPRAVANMLRVFDRTVREIDPDICFFTQALPLQGWQRCACVVTSGPPSITRTAGRFLQSAPHL